MTISAVLVVSEDLVGRPGIPHRQPGAVKSDVVELVGEAAPRPLPAERVVISALAY